MSDGNIKRVAWLSLLGINALIWYSIFTNGFFITITWVVILSAITGIIIKLKENV
jgi:hypothetical protein